MRAVIRDGQSTYEKLLNKAKLITVYEERLQQYYSMFDVKVKHGMTALRTSGGLFSVNSTGYNFRGADFHIPRFHLVANGRHSNSKYEIEKYTFAKNKNLQKLMDKWTL